VKRGTLGCLFELLETLLLTLIVFLAVQMFVAQPYQIQQQSMEDTLMPDQYVLVDKLTPRFEDYHRGDIVVFHPPAALDPSGDGTPFIKRIIGVAGDTVDIHDGHVFVNGDELSEPYVFEGQATEPIDPNQHVWQIGDGQLFVMGDHRAESQDSRSFGPIQKSSVIGRAWLRYWPMSQFGMITAPEPSPTPAKVQDVTIPPQPESTIVWPSGPIEVECNFSPCPIFPTSKP
jgi:signal peptidase I